MTAAIYTPPPPSRPVSQPPPPRPAPPPSRPARIRVAALYAIGALTVPIAGMWAGTVATHHKVADSDALTVLLVLGLAVYAAVTIILTPTRRERRRRLRT